jgi:hypothetical protein
MTIYTKIAQSKENLLTIKKNCLQKSNFLRARISSKNCSQQKFAHRICLQHRKTAHNEEPCWLGWINTMAKCLASSQSAHGWRAPRNGLCRNGWNILEGPAIHSELEIKKRNAPAGREIDSVLCLASSVDLDMPVI